LIWVCTFCAWEGKESNITVRGTCPSCSYSCTLRPIGRASEPEEETSDREQMRAILIARRRREGLSDDQT
jgi:hypothetical protein